METIALVGRRRNRRTSSSHVGCQCEGKAVRLRVEKAGKTMKTHPRTQTQQAHTSSKAVVLKLE
jgi:hypothetical protein